MNYELRTLKANEIEVRPQQINQYGNKVSGNFLLYINARTAVNILNETFGLNWKKEFYFLNDVNGNSYLVCRISVYNEKMQEWIYREDVGTESNTEKEKGLFSDSFKRAIVGFGLTELYTSPSINILLNEDEYYSKNNKIYMKSNVSFSVKEICYNENREIVKLSIVDKNNKTRFYYEVKPKVELSEEQMYLIDQLFNKADSLNILKDKLLLSIKRKYNKEIVELTEAEIKEVMNLLK